MFHTSIHTLQPMCYGVIVHANQIALDSGGGGDPWSATGAVLGSANPNGSARNQRIMMKHVWIWSRMTRSSARP